MMQIDVEKETLKFKEKFLRGDYEINRSQNTEKNYAEEKELRDTKAVKNFLETDLFEYIINMK